MENLKKCFSSKFLEKVQELGEILPINDELFYLVFKPNNNRAVSVHFKNKNKIKIVECIVSNYEPLTINHVCEGLEEYGNEGNILWTLKTINNN